MSSYFFRVYLIMLFCRLLARKSMLSSSLNAVSLGVSVGVGLVYFYLFSFSLPMESYSSAILVLEGS